MKNFNTWAFALFLAVGLSSCTLSYQYCDAYNGVDFEQAEKAAEDDLHCNE